MSSPATSPTAFVPVPMSGPDITDLEVSSVSAVLSSGLPQSRAAARRVRGTDRMPDRRAARRRRIQWHRRPSPCHYCCRHRGRGSRHNDSVLIRGVGKLRLYERGIPVFVDVDPATGNLDPDSSIRLFAICSTGARRGGAGFRPHVATPMPAPAGSRRFSPFTHSVSRRTWIGSSMSLVPTA